MIEFIFTAFVLYAISLVIVALVLIYWWVYHSPEDYDLNGEWFICLVILWPGILMANFLEYLCLKLKDKREQRFKK